MVAYIVAGPGGASGDARGDTTSHPALPRRLPMRPPKARQGGVRRSDAFGLPDPSPPGTPHELINARPVPSLARRH